MENKLTILTLRHLMLIYAAAQHKHNNLLSFN